MMTIYISLPITGQEDAARRKAQGIKAALSRKGHRPVNPFDIYPGKNPTYADYLCYDLLALADCDAIYLCEGWQYSRGCRIERAFAQEFGLQLIYEDAGTCKYSSGDNGITQSISMMDSKRDL